MFYRRYLKKNLMKRMVIKVKKKGTTLIEVLVAAVILTAGGASVMMSFAYCHKAILNSTHRYNSSLIINEHLEELTRRETETEIVDYITKWNKTEYTKEISEGLFSTYTLLLRPAFSVIPTTATTNLSRVTATVFWETSNGQRNYSITIMTNEPG